MKVKFLQEGGEMAPETQGAPMGPEAAPAGQDEALQQLAQLAQQIIQQLGPEAAAALAQMILEAVNQGGAAEQLPAEEEQPVFRMGGKVLQRGRR